MLKLYNVTAVLRNIESVFRHQDIRKLNNTAYKWLYPMSGFTSHYNLLGFQGAYSNLRDLLRGIKSALPIEKELAVRDINDPNHNGYGIYYCAYCKSKLAIVEGLEKIVAEYEDKTIKDGLDEDEHKFQSVKEMVRRAETDEEFRKLVLEMYRKVELNK